MSHRGRAWVEKVDGEIVRVFRRPSAARCSNAWDEGRVTETARIEAVHAIRKKVFELSKNQCMMCSKLLTFSTMEMDEKIPRSQGGEISIYNSQALCRACHTKKHNRIVKWTQLSLDNAKGVW